MIVSLGSGAEDNLGLPIAPIVVAGTTVAAALTQAQAWSARAVVEVAENVVRIHAVATLQATEKNGEGGLSLGLLPALEVGRRRLEAVRPLIPGTAVGLAVAFAAPPDDLNYPASVMAFRSPIFGGDIAGAVTRAYKCPTDGEIFNGPGKCDLHDVDLVPDNGT